MRALHEGFEEDLKDVLTQEQLEMYREHLPARPHMEFENQKNGREFHAMILQKRREFDRVLSEEEKETINALRDEIRQRRDERRVANPGSGSYPGGRRALGRQMHERMCALDLIIENHRAELDAIRETIPPEARPGHEMHPKSHHRGGPAWRGESQSGRERHFLLLDPDRITGAIIDVDAGDSENIKLYPNPVKELLNIDFETVGKGNVTIELLNKDGAVLEMVDETYRTAGSHSVKLDVTHLRAGEIHYIRITSTMDSMIKKFIKM